MAIEFKQPEADPKYGQLPKEIIDLLVDLDHSNFRENIPVPFCGLTIYPIKVRDYEVFANCSECFTLNKNTDPKGIAKSHLDYLISKTQISDNNEGQIWSYKISKLFELIFHIKNGLKCKKCGHVIQYTDTEFVQFSEKMQEFSKNGTIPENQEEIELKCPECGDKDFSEMIKIISDPTTKKHSLVVDDHSITSKDFNKLRQIVLYQNFYDYVDDSWVDASVKQDHDEKIRLEQQKNDIHATIEKKVVCLSITTNYKIDDIYDMSIRHFTLALATVDDLINYKIMRQAVSSGFVSLPKDQKIEHWIYKPNKDIYGDSYKSTDDIKESVSNL